MDLTPRYLGRRHSEFCKPAVGGVEILDHEVERGIAWFDLNPSLQNEVRPGSKLKNREIVTFDEGPHPEVHHEFVRLSKAIGREGNVTNPHGGSAI